MKVKKNNGFTLLELIIAISIISIVGLTFYSFLNNSIRINGKNERDIKALNVCQTEIENLREQIKTKDIKSSLEIKIDDINKVIIKEDINDDLYWTKKQNSTEDEEEIIISSTGLYKNYIGENKDGNKDNTIIKYKRNNKSDKYDVNLKLTRKKVGSRYLYKINVSAGLGENYFSKKITTLTTEILSK